ncbi:unnamed protein product [Rotaria magnacalcarata]|uniref:Pentapeptide repeat-containing protein n=2 Tax=Rotaria magnacalcarata TaxID=392030 RepID=A0A817AQ80_9BILA|nr:unnamed protein product [Rotaria magnacalcarata]
MVCLNRDTQISSQSSFFYFQLKDIFKILGVLLVPLTLGVATTLLSIQQTKLNQKNRENDIDIAQKQRQQDVFLAVQAEKERILATYLQDLATLLLDKNIIFDKNSAVSSIVRAKTLTTLIQMDAPRKRQVILFLYEAKLIKRNSKYALINLFDADLDNLDMSLSESKIKHYKTYEKIDIQLRGASLVNSSFKWRHLDFSDFSQADLKGTNFQYADLSNVDFSYAHLSNTDFRMANVSKAMFAYANLSNSSITDEQLSTALTLQGAILPNHATAPVENLIMNGDAEQRCSNNHAVFLPNWTLTNGSISAVWRPQSKTELNSKCSFSSLSHHDISAMHQTVDLNDYVDWLFNGRTLYGFQITLSGTRNGKHYVIINLRHRSSDGKILENITICREYETK